MQSLRSLAFGNHVAELFPCRVAVKRCRSSGTGLLGPEMRVLKQIALHEGNPLLPSLVFHNANLSEFGLLPVGKPCDPVVILYRAYQARGALGDILRAITWLYGRNIIHCNVRWGNVVQSEHRFVFVGLGSSTVISTPESKVGYCGGFICCPPRLLGDLKQLYEPEKMGRLYAYVMLTNSLFFPASVKGFQSQCIEEPGRGENARHLRKKLEVSRFWGRFVSAAETKDVEVLSDFVMLDLEPRPGM